MSSDVGEPNVSTVMEETNRDYPDLVEEIGAVEEVEFTLNELTHSTIFLDSSMQSPLGDQKKAPTCLMKRMIVDSKSFYCHKIRRPSDRTEYDIKVLLRTIQHFPVFANLPLATRSAMCAVMNLVMTKKAGTIVLKDGEELDSWSVIIVGKVEVQHGGERVEELHVGDSFGVLPTTEKMYHQGVMRTKVNNCQFLCIRQMDYYRIFHPDNESTHKQNEDGPLHDHQDYVKRIRKEHISIRESNRDHPNFVEEISAVEDVETTVNEEPIEGIALFPDGEVRTTEAALMNPEKVVGKRETKEMDGELKSKNTRKKPKMTAKHPKAAKETHIKTNKNKSSKSKSPKTAKDGTPVVPKKPYLKKKLLKITEKKKKPSQLLDNSDMNRTPSPFPKGYSTNNKTEKNSRKVNKIKGKSAVPKQSLIMKNLDTKIVSHSKQTEEKATAECLSLSLGYPTSAPPMSPLSLPQLPTLQYKRDSTLVNDALLTDLCNGNDKLSSNLLSNDMNNLDMTNLDMTNLDMTNLDLNIPDFVNEIIGSLSATHDPLLFPLSTAFSQQLLDKVDSTPVREELPVKEDNGDKLSTLLLSNLVDETIQPPSLSPVHQTPLLTSSTSLPELPLGPQLPEVEACAIHEKKGIIRNKHYEQEKIKITGSAAPTTSSLTVHHSALGLGLESAGLRAEMPSLIRKIIKAPPPPVHDGDSKKIKESGSCSDEDPRSRAPGQV